MNFDDYPLDWHTCQFQVGSCKCRQPPPSLILTAADYDTQETVTCTSFYIYDTKRQRSLQHFIQIEQLPLSFATVVIPSGTYAACGFQVRVQRKQMQFVVQVSGQQDSYCVSAQCSVDLQVYLPSCMFVIVSWVSFLVKPEVVPGRMAMLVTLFLVLINIFNSVR